MSSDAAGELPATIAIRTLKDFMFCHRRAYLTWVDAHVVKPNDSEYFEGAIFSHEQAIKRWESIFREKVKEGYFVSEKFGLEGNVEYVSTPSVDDTAAEIPVLIRTTSPSKDGMPWEEDRTIAVACALLLGDGEYTPTGAWIFYGGEQSDVRHLVDVDDLGISKTEQLVDDLRQMAASNVLPDVIDDLEKCMRCPFVSLCRTDECEPSRPEKAVWVSDDVSRPLYVTGSDVSLYKTGGIVQVRRRDEVLDEVRLIELSQVNLYGASRISTPLVTELLRRDIPIAYFSSGGWFNGLTVSSGSGRIDLRIRQFKHFCEGDLELSKSIVAGKVRNCRTLLKRNANECPDADLIELRQIYKEDIPKCESFSELLGVEGNAARIYFKNFALMLKLHNAERASMFDFNGRNRRPPRDPVNCMLSYLYGVMVKDIFVELQKVGFDPMLGFFHKPRFGRPSLALDLAEEFRPLVADSTAITLINKRIVGSEDFVIHPRGVTLTPSGKRKLISGYQARVETEVQHRELGYRISYKRAYEAQARLLASYLYGDRGSYNSFTTR
ncbi:CRISP-associated protein Cas1 [Ferrithrix thermotolerans DSM 19514]|uniref:CRISPR-associated endonuclease Cas1 n=1 Tax=Ferrithrix thermotolerans DSM 19514 TaxID=1121881 RepID=A0A1M4XMY8_9ACTN|nr:CRISPR-associated endonuclease Cas1 [Ferrithrix thermotolerans]SHE94845.1 CRISP-associated protein Cas1 [Ferrithrix thermotolerans DSM 19514]